MKVSLLALGLGWVLGVALVHGGAASLHAATASDFYCRKADAGWPVYYEMIVNDCGPANTLTKRGVCGVTALCTYVGDNEKLKKALAEAKTEQEKADLVEEKAKKRDWFPSNLTCKPKSSDSNLGIICPTPDECRGDVYYSVKTTFVSPDRMKASADLQNDPSNSPVFQVQPAAGAAK